MATSLKVDASTFAAEYSNCGVSDVYMHELDNMQFTQLYHARTLYSQHDYCDEPNLCITSDNLCTGHSDRNKTLSAAN